MLLNAHKLIQRMDQQDMIVVGIEDVTIHRREQKLAAFKEMADNAPVMIWVAGQDKMRTFFSKTWLDFSGRSLEEETGNGWAERIHPDERELCMQTYSASFDASTPFKIEYRLRRHDGEYRWLMEMGKPSFSTLGEYTGFIGSCTDIHSQVMLNEERDALIKERTQELVDVNLQLERSNEELRQFAYVASHDLQEPLRKIVTFSNIMQKRFSDILPEAGVDQLTRIVAASTV